VWDNKNFFYKNSHVPRFCVKNFIKIGRWEVSFQACRLAAIVGNVDDFSKNYKKCESIGKNIFFNKNSLSTSLVYVEKIS
jgi:hypothetical protein